MNASIGAGARRANRAWHPRQGAVLVMVALMSVVIIGLLAIAVDFSRAYAQKNEMQTSVDAAALAGVLELFQDPATVVDSAIAFGQSNKVQTYVIGANRYAVVCGTWDDTAAQDTQFTASDNCSSSDNAVKVQVQDSVQYLFSNLFSVVRKQQTTSGLAWMAFIEGTRCIKPWAMRYTLLTKSLQPLNPDTLRALTDADIDSLQTIPRERRRFKLKSAAPPTDPGNFGSLDIPNDSTTAQGAQLYRTNIATCNEAFLEPGDIVYAQTGAMVGPTKQGARVLCQPLTAGGECDNAKGEMGVLSIAALWFTDLPVVNGMKPLIVQQLVSFTLDSVTADASIIGTFVPGVHGGTVGSTRGTIRRPVLVR